LHIVCCTALVRVARIPLQVRLAKNGNPSLSEDPVASGGWGYWFCENPASFLPGEKRKSEFKRGLGGPGIPFGGIWGRHCEPGL
jgi:hypothetical protein